MKRLIIGILFCSIFISNIIRAQTSLQLDGINDYISFPEYSPAWNFGSTFTIEIRIKTNTIANQFILGTGNCGVVCPSWNLMIGKETTCNNVGTPGHVVFWGDFSGAKMVESNAVVTTSAWTHVAVTCDGSNLLMYINGVLQNLTTTVSGTISNSRFRFIGADPDSYGSCSGNMRNLFYGAIDEFRIWNTTRTAGQIYTTMNNRLQGNESGLVAYYQFEDGTGSSSVTDVTGHGYTGALTNMNTATCWISSVYLPLVPVAIWVIISAFIFIGGYAILRIYNVKRAEKFL
jgi:hypothetical protein